jgi:hypothetical protein
VNDRNIQPFDPLVKRVTLIDTLAVISALSFKFFDAARGRGKLSFEQSDALFLAVLPGIVQLTLSARKLIGQALEPKRENLLLTAAQLLQLLKMASLILHKDALGDAIQHLAGKHM